jgi:hypothetical protein
MQLVEQEPLWGRFGYSDLKEAALSGALDLWVLNRIRLVLGI